MIEAYGSPNEVFIFNLLWSIFGLLYLYNFQSACNDIAIHMGSGVWFFTPFMKDSNNIILSNLMIATMKMTPTKMKSNNLVSYTNQLAEDSWSRYFKCRSRSRHQYLWATCKQVGRFLLRALLGKALARDWVYYDPAFIGIFKEVIHRMIHVTVRGHWDAKKYATLRRLAGYLTSVLKLRAYLVCSGIARQPNNFSLQMLLKNNVQGYFPLLWYHSLTDITLIYRKYPRRPYRRRRVALIGTFIFPKPVYNCKGMPLLVKRTNISAANMQALCSYQLLPPLPAYWLCTQIFHYGIVASSFRFVQLSDSSKKTTSRHMKTNRPARYYAYYQFVASSSAY